MSCSFDAGKVVVRAAVAAGMIGLGFFTGYLIGRQKKKCHHDLCEDALVKYAIDHSLRLTPVQGRLIAATKAHPQSYMLSSPDQIQLLQIIVKSLKAKKTLDIGVYTGYSAMSIAQVLPEDGKVIGVEWDEAGPAIGRPFWQEAGVEHKIDLRMGPAIQILQALVDDGQSNTFDFAFIDGDQLNYLNFFEYCIKLLRPGGIMVCDNVLWFGSVLETSGQEGITLSLQHFNRTIAKDTRVDLIMLNIGDGMTLAMKK